jgi:hypothetical protein
MQPRCEVERVQPQGIHPAIRQHTRPFSRCIWTISVVNALLSARYLLVEANFHYPVALYVAQIAVTAIFAGLQYTLVRNDTPPKPWKSQVMPGSVLAIAAMCFAAFSMMCMLQALLHNKNLTTLVMLTVSSFMHEVRAWNP